MRLSSTDLVTEPAAENYLNTCVDENADKRTAAAAPGTGQEEKEQDSEEKWEQTGDCWDDSNSSDDEITQEQQFQQVKNLPSLVSRHSMLSRGLQEIQAGHNYTSSPVLAPTSRPSSAPGNPAVRSPRQESLNLLWSGGQAAMGRPHNATSESSPISTRTTRLNMLSRELPEWLRRNLLEEKQSKSRTVNAVLKREWTRSTTNSGLGSSHPRVDKSTDPACFCDDSWDYHSRGW